MSEMKSLTLNDKTYDGFVDPVARELAASTGVIKSASGRSISISDPSSGKLFRLNIYGKTIQDGTPTPDAPAELVSAGDAGSVTVAVAGKNLMSNNWLQGMLAPEDGTKITHNDYWITNADYIAVDSDKDYVLSADTTNFSCVFWYDEGKNFISYEQPLRGQTSRVLTLPDRAKFVRFAYNYSGAAEVITPALMGVNHWVQLEIGSTATNFEAYMATTAGVITITEDGRRNGLPGIPVDAGGNYTDANGQQWICDEIDLARGVHIQRLGKWIIDGSKVPTTFIAGNNGGTVLGYLYTDVMSGISTNRMPKLCDKLRAPEVVNPVSYKDCEVGFWFFNTGGAATPDVFLVFNLGEFSSAEEAASYLQSNPLTFIGILATPIETPLSAEEITAYADLHTYRNHTTVSNDAGAYMELEYVMDAKKYIDSLIGSGGAGGASPARLASVTLRASAWNGADSLYSQVVTIAGTTEYSKVDLLPSVEQLAIFHNKDVAFVTENEDGVVTVFAIGDKPTQDYTMQVSITEVAV